MPHKTLTYILVGPIFEDETLFWNKDHGWSQLDRATKYTSEQLEGMEMPQGFESRKVAADK